MTRRAGRVVATAFVLALLPGWVLGCSARRSGSSPSRTSPAVSPAGAEAAAGVTPTPTATPAAAPGKHAPPPPPPPVDFETQVRPLLEEKCSPCHFPGGRMYERMPFDREGTIREAGERILPRLREPMDQELVRTYLVQHSGKKDDAGP